jgi:hypothetical protein
MSGSGLRSRERSEWMLVGVFLGGGRGRALRFQRGDDVVLADAQHVAVYQAIAARAALGERLHIVVDVDAVGADVLQVEVALAELHAGVVRRNVAQRVGEHPVVVGRAANGAALHGKDRGAAVGKRPPLVTDDTQPKRHGSPTQRSSSVV